MSLTTLASICSILAFPAAVGFYMTWIRQHSERLKFAKSQLGVVFALAFLLFTGSSAALQSYLLFTERTQTTTSRSGAGTSAPIGTCLTKEERKNMEDILCDRSMAQGSLAISYSPNAQSRGCAYDFLEAFGACPDPDRRWRIFRPLETEIADGVSVQFKSSPGGGRAELAFDQAVSLKVRKRKSDRVLEDVVIEIGNNPASLPR